MNVGIYIFSGCVILISFLEIMKIVIAKIRCTECVEATVVDIDVKKNGEDQQFYFFFGYRFEGVDYRVKSDFDYGSYQFYLGDQVKIYVSPKNPEKIYCPEGMGERVAIDLFFCVVGVLILLIYLLNK